MGNINSSRHFLATNLVACVLISILDIRFSVAYISYFWIVLLSYLIYCVWRERDYKHLILRTCRHNWPNIKLLLLGIVIFYGLLLLSSLLLKDKVSVKTAIDWLRYTFPFFGFVFLASLCNINKGIAYGVCISVIANATFSGLQLGGIGSLLFWDMTRIQGFFDNPNSFGSVLTWNIPFVAYFLIKSKTVSERVLFTFALVLAIFCLILTNSRGAITSLLIGINGTALLYVLAHRNQLGIGNKLAIIFLCLALAVGTGIGLNSSIHSNRGLGERQLMWSTSIQMWEDHKFLGVGVGRWSENYYSERYHPFDGHEMGHYFPHNMPIYFLSGAGVLGAIGYLCLILSMFYVLLRKVIETNKITLAIPMMVVFIAFVMDGMVDATLTNKTVGVPYYALLGYVIGMVHKGGKH